MSQSRPHPLQIKLSCFVTLSDQDKDALQDIEGEVRVVPSRTALSVEGSAPSDVLLVLDGMAARHKHLAHHRRQIVSFMLPGDLSDFETVTPRVLDHGAEAVSKCRILVISRPVLAELMQRPAIAEAMHVSANVEAAIIKEWLVNVGRRTSVERVAHLLCEFLFRLRAIGLAEDDRMVFPVTKMDLADSTCLSVVHVNRILQDFRDSRLLRLDDDILEILDPSALQRTGGFSDEYLELPIRFGRPGSDFSRGSGNAASP